MQQDVPKASGSGLTKPRKEDEWAAKEIHLADYKDNESELPNSLNCSSLIALYLQGNYELTAIPPPFFQRMALLQVLDLSHSTIKSLPTSLTKLVSLKKLLLRGCLLFMELSPLVGKLKNLEELDLDETQIMCLPKEIGKLLKIRHLRVSFYHICAKMKSKSNFLIHPETTSNLSQLAELGIDVNPADKRWDDLVETVVKEVCHSKSLRSLSLYLPEFQLLDYMKLIYPSLSCFRFTVGHHKRRIISRVPHEVEAEFRNWDKCLNFVNGVNIPIEIKRVLKFSSSFFLDHHAAALNLSEFGVENMKKLKFCLLAECNKMETLIDGEMLHERNSEDRSESDPGSVKHVLESLEYLNIYYMENLWSIWRGPNLHGCMSKLKFLALHTCPSLSNIFSPNLLENFINLEEMILEDCPRVTSLVSHGSFKPMMSDKIFLPSLKKLLLLYLPKLVSISNGISIAPKLESIAFYNCPKLKSISKMELSSKNLKMIKGEYHWWEDMNWNETEWGSQPDYLMRIFSPINKEKDLMSQLAEDRDIFEAPRQNEGQQLGDVKLLEVSTQDCKDHWSDYTKEKISGTEVTKSPTGMFPSKPCLRTADASEQAWSFFSSEKNKRPAADHFDRPSETTEVDDEDEPQAKRCNYAEDEKEGVIGYGSKTTGQPCYAFRTRSDASLLDDGYRWRKYGQKIDNKNPNPRCYYKCSSIGCPVKKRTERDFQDMSFLITTYKGVHNHERLYAKGLSNLHHRANSVEDAADAAKTISSTKGHRDVFEASIRDKGALPGYATIPEASIRDESQQSGNPCSLLSDSTEEIKTGTDVTESTALEPIFPLSTPRSMTSKNMSELEQRNLINELTQGTELAKQLLLHLNVHSTSDHETVQKILASNARALSMLDCNTSSAAKPHPSELVIRSSELQCSGVGSTPQSEVDDRGFKEQELKDDSKKRITLPRWTQLIQVTSVSSLEGPHDDGFSWRKYGQKDILGAKYPRSYYRCTHRNDQNCWATKQVQRSDDDPTIFEVTYRGTHTCTPASHETPSSRPSEISTLSSAKSDITSISMSPNSKLDGAYCAGSH